jgi:predicted PurR-regulated permease PerM
MNKDQVIWLIIRLFGVYFAFLALVTFFSLVGAIPALFTLPKIDTNPKNANLSMPQNPTVKVQPISPNENPEFDEMTGKTEKKSDESITAKFRGENVSNFLWFLIVTGVYGVVAWYFLRDGRIMFSLLNREVPPKVELEREAEVTTLNLSGKRS